MGVLPRIQDHIWRRLRAAGWALWALAAGVLICRLAVRLDRWIDVVRQSEVLSEVLCRQSEETARYAQEALASTLDLRFLQSLDILPQNPGAVRTQKAIGDDVEALRRKVGRRLGNERHILVDSRANKLYLKQGLIQLWEADCSVGRGGILTDPKTGRRWEFITPRGEFRVLKKIEKPLWVKPDWAFVEAKQNIPPPNDPSRHEAGELGSYGLYLGNGYLIHGTRNEALLGRPVSHGCVRLGAADLQRLYETVPVGTRVYIY